MNNKLIPAITYLLLLVSQACSSSPAIPIVATSTATSTSQPSTATPTNTPLPTAVPALAKLMAACNTALPTRDGIYPSGQWANVYLGSGAGQFNSIDELIQSGYINSCIFGNHDPLTIGDKTWDPNITALYDYIKANFPSAIGATPDEVFDTTAIYPRGIIIPVSASAVVVGGKLVDPKTPLRIPKDGDSIGIVGWEGIQVWGSNIIKYCYNDQLVDFICGNNPNINTYTWDASSPWYFAGQASVGYPKTVAFQFDQPYKTIMITGINNILWGIDSIVGILADGRKVPFGYAIGRDGQLDPVGLFFDSPYYNANDVQYFVGLERNNIHPAVNGDCGWVGQTSDGSFTILNPGAQAVQFRMIDSPNANGPLRGERHVYQLAGLEITFGMLPANPRNCPAQSTH